VLFVPGIPLQLGSDDQFRALRSLFADARYDEAGVCERTGIGTIFDFQSKLEGRETGTGLNDPLDALIRLLIDGEVLAEDFLLALIPANRLGVLEQLGVLGRTPAGNSYYATVHLYPVGSLYVASDRTIQIDGTQSIAQNDAVYAAVTRNTERFLGSLPTSPCERLLDMCAGTGIAGMMAASRYAGQAWSCDLTERSVRFAEFSRRLNGLDNVTCAQGDLYQAVGSETFDRIVAHPPYVPTDKDGMVYRDGGEDGEQVLRGIIAGLPGHLRPGGRCYCMTMATDRESNSFEQRIRGWLGERDKEFDVMLVAYSIQTPAEFLRNAALQTKGRVDLGPHRELLKRLQVTSTFYGAVVIERLTARRLPITARTRKSPEASGETVEWFVRWTTMAAAPGFDDLLLASRPHLASHLILDVQHTVEGGALTPSRFELRSDFPYTVAAVCPPYLAVIAQATDGARNAREIFTDLTQRQAIPPEITVEQFLQHLRVLISYGLLELDEYPLPQ
jgi:Methyltransferase small domain